MLRRLLAAPLLLIALICAIGAVRMFTHDLPDSSFDGRVFAAVFAAVAGGCALLMLRPDLRGMRAASWAGFQRWALLHPLGQAALTYVVALILMAAWPKYQMLPGFFAFCAYSLMAPATAAFQRRWWSTAGLVLIGWLVLFFALAGTSEALAPRGFGEGGMVFLLPLMAFPVLLVLSGVVRWLRGAGVPVEAGRPN